MKPIMTKTPDGKFSICYMLFNEFKSFVTTNETLAKKEYRRLKTVLAKHRKGRPNRMW
jgi:hypothetical protein